MVPKTFNIAVLGGGAWGLALATLYHNTGHNICVFTHDDLTLKALETGQAHERVLKNVSLPRMPVTSDMTRLAEFDIILVAVRAQSLRRRLEAISQFITPNAQVVLCCKGIETSTGLFMSELCASVLPQATVAVLSGPSFASDVALGLPTAVSLASASHEGALELCTKLQAPHFRPYASGDVIGVEIGGSIKNVLALACGMAKGLELGQSAHAALLSRGFAEMSRLGLTLGARLETMSGLSGLGDLVLTCGSTQSRNTRFGIALGQGKSRADISREFTEIAEGVTTASALIALAQKQGVDMPICSAVNSVLAGHKTAGDAANMLLTRPIKAERAP